MKRTSIAVLLLFAVWLLTKSYALGQARPSSNAGNSQEQAYYDALFAKQRAQQAAADAAAMTYDGCCNNDRDKAIRYCKHWAAGWNKDAPVWEGWNDRRFRVSVRTLDSNPLRTLFHNGATTYCPEVLLEQYAAELALKVPNWCFGQPGSKYKSLDEQHRWGADRSCTPTPHTVTLEEKQLAEIATAKDDEFEKGRCLENDPRPAALQQADHLCIQRAQEALDAQKREKERKQAEKREAQLKVTLAARQQALRALGLHRNQSQAQVKFIIQQQGFEPWRCDSNMEETDCLAVRRRGSSDRDELTMIFINVLQQHRDQDTGVDYTDRIDRTLATVGYREGKDGNLVSVGPDPF